MVNPLALPVPTHRGECRLHEWRTRHAHGRHGSQKLVGKTIMLKTVHSVLTHRLIYCSSNMHLTWCWRQADVYIGACFIKPNLKVCKSWNIGRLIIYACASHCLSSRNGNDDLCTRAATKKTAKRSLNEAVKLVILYSIRGRWGHE